MATKAVNLPNPPAAAAGAGDKVNPRRMRRIIVEDPTWNKSLVPSLRDLCLGQILADFQENPILDAVPAEFRDRILTALPSDLPLSLTAHLIGDEAYWRRCCMARFPNSNIHRHGGSWKRLFMERYLQEALERFVPGTDDEEALKRSIAFAQPLVQVLDLTELQPPADVLPPENELEPLAEPLPEGAKLDTDPANPDTDDEENEEDEDVVRDHLDLSNVVELLPNLHTLKVAFKKKDCGMAFRWNMFGATNADALLVGDCVKYSPQLQYLSVTESLLDDRKVRLLAAKLLDNKSLVSLDLSMNAFGDRGARALAKLLNGHCQLAGLNLAENQIAPVGARALAMGLMGNGFLTTLNLRRNDIGDQGAHALFTALCEQTTLRRLNVSCNGITARASSSLSELIEKNKSLEQLDLSGNELGDETGKRLLDALDHNSSLMVMDTRLTGFSNETELAINDVLGSNMNKQTIS